MAKINVRSPFYVNLTATRLTSVDMELWIYTGTQTTDRTSSNGLQGIIITIMFGLIIELETILEVLLSLLLLGQVIGGSMVMDIFKMVQILL